MKRNLLILALIVVIGAVSFATGNTRKLGIRPASGEIVDSGIATLEDGFVTVQTSQATSTSKIFLTRTAISPDNTVAPLVVRSVDDGNSFTIESGSGSDDSSVSWMIVN